MKRIFEKTIAFLFVAMGLCIQPVIAQDVSGNKDAATAMAAKPDADLEKKSAEWANALQLNDAGKAQRVQTAILAHLTAVRDWHNTHPFSLTPAGINPATGNRLSDMDRQIIICSTKPVSIHANLMDVLKTELDTTQQTLILDKYTIGKVAFTLKGYQAIVPDLTAKEEAEIIKNLRQAREQAIDYKSIREVSAIFEIYKTKCEQYLNNNGRNWRQLFKAYVDKVKAEKAAKNKQ